MLEIFDWTTVTTKQHKAWHYFSLLLINHRSEKGWSGIDILWHPQHILGDLIFVVSIIMRINRSRLYALSVWMKGDYPKWYAVWGGTCFVLARNGCFWKQHHEDWNSELLPLPELWNIFWPSFSLGSKSCVSFSQGTRSIGKEIGESRVVQLVLTLAKNKGWYIVQHPMSWSLLDFSLLKVAFKLGKRRFCGVTIAFPCFHKFFSRTSHSLSQSCHVQRREKFWFPVLQSQCHVMIYDNHLFIKSKLRSSEKLWGCWTLRVFTRFNKAEHVQTPDCSGT